MDAYEGLHQDTSKARLAIESKLESRYVGQVPCSPKLQRYIDTIDFWKRIVKLQKGVDASQTELRRLSRKLGVYSALYADLPPAVLQLKLAYKAYREAKLQAPDWRDEHNQSLIEAYIAERKPQNKTATQIKARMKREQQQRDLGLASRTIRGAITKNAVLKAIAQDEEGVDRVPETQEEMVPAMAASNLARQQQCVGTPSMMPSFLEDFGYLADTPAAMTLIDGSYEPPAGTDPYMVELLSCTEMPPSLRAATPFHFVVNKKENKLAWMKERERTAGEPSCLSFAHYKAASHDEMLNSVDTLLRMVPLLVGISPEA